jgi:hypothetical protein
MEGVLHPVHGSAARIPIQKIYFRPLAGSEAGSVVEHRICAELRGVALAALRVMREDLYSTLRLSTSTAISTMF